MQESLSADLGLSEEPMQRLPAIRPVDRIVTTQPPSRWVIDTITAQWRDRGFVVAEPSEKYDPVVGHVTEWFGYEK